MKPQVSLFAAALCVAAPLAAQTTNVTTDPVGVLRYVFQADSDTAMSLPLHRPTEFAGGVGTVGSNWITAAALTNSPINWVDNDWTYGVGTNASSTYYAMFTTGALEGAWFQITGNNSNTLFLDTAGLASLSGAGVAASNKFEVIPFWTLASLFPNGQGITPAANPFAPETVILLTDQQTPGINLPSQELFFYYNGGIGIVPAGWYPPGNPFAPAADDNPLPPDTYFLVRASSTTTTNFVAGGVAMNDFRTQLGRLQNGTEQDNFIGFGFPIDTTLIGSGLHNAPGFTKSPNPFAPEDIVLVYDQNASGINKPAQELYFYYDGSIGMVPAAWYEVGNPFGGSKDSNIVFRAGSAVIVRKAAGAASSDGWAATPPYAN